MTRYAHSALCTLGRADPFVGDCRGSRTSRSQETQEEGQGMRCALDGGATATFRAGFYQQRQAQRHGGFSLRIDVQHPTHDLAYGEVWRFRFPAMCVARANHGFIEQLLFHSNAIELFSSVLAVGLDVRVTREDRLVARKVGLRWVCGKRFVPSLSALNLPRAYRLLLWPALPLSNVHRGENHGQHKHAPY